MKKEVIFAILLGLGVGLIITVGVFRARQTLKSDPSGSNTAISVSPKPSSGQVALSSPTTIGMSIFAPQDEEILMEKTLTIAGQTYPESFITVMVNKKNYFSKADKDGHFSLPVSLDFGGNALNIHSLDSEGKEGQAERFVTFYDKMLEDDVPEPSVPPSPVASPSASSKPPSKPRSPTPSASPK